MKKKYIIITISICLIILLIIFENSRVKTAIILGQYTDIEIEVSEKIVTETKIENALID